MKIILLSCILTIACLIICDKSEASDLAALSLYDSKTLYIHYSFMGNGFFKNGEIMPLGTFGSNLAKEISKSESALAEIQKARKYGIISTIALGVGMIVSISGIVMMIKDEDDSFTFDIVSIVIGTACNTVAGVFGRSSMTALNRAVWLYNREVMSGYIK